MCQPACGITFGLVFGNRLGLYYFFKKCLFIYLAAPGLSCGMQTLSCGMQTLSCSMWECGVLATGPLGKSWDSPLEEFGCVSSLLVCMCFPVGCLSHFFHNYSMVAYPALPTKADITGRARPLENGV